VKGRGAAREEWLRNTILALESGAEVRRDLLAPLRRFGARIPRGRGSDPDDLEYVEPGRNWPEEQAALFWRLVAAAFADRYSDALLNLKAQALERAAAWYLAVDPDLAIVLLARRARALTYASWGDKEVLAPIDAALAVYRPDEHAPAAEYDFILQTLEVLDRLRSWRDDDIPRSGQVLALGLRGLEVADELGQAPQRARLYHAVADALTREPPAIDAGTSARIAALLGEQAAEAAWRRAIDLEDGDFYGEVTASRRAERVQQYRWGLALLDLHHGATARALEVLESSTGATCYERRQQLRRLMKLLAARSVSRAVRLGVITRAVRRDVVEANLDSDFDREQAVEYAKYALYQVANLGGGEEHAAVVREALARPGMAEAIESARRAREESDAVIGAQTERLADALVAAWDSQDPDEAAEQRARQLAAESPAERAARVAHEVAGEVVTGGAELLVELLVHPSEGGDRVALEANLTCPEHALDAVRADPAVAAMLDALAARVRGALPGCAVELRVKSACLAHGPGDDPFTGPSLAAAGARAALAALGLDADPPPDAEAYRRLRSRRRSELLFAT
jgi:hypothetical protein